jgi:VWFA-related protein
MISMTRRVIVIAVIAAGVYRSSFAQQPASPSTQMQPASPAGQPPSPPPQQTAPGTTVGSAPQNSGGAYTIQRTVRLVVLDMVVTDAKGNVVNDLSKQDFHVEEAGGPQDIQTFEQAGAHTPDPQISIDSTADLDRLAPRAPVNIILLDEFNTRFEDMAFARYSLKKYLEKQPGKLTAPTILIAVNLQKFTVLQDYTQNKDEILTALEKHLVAYPWQQEQGAWVGERYATAFITLRRVAEAVLGHPGHKNMIWIGRGFPSLNYARLPVDAQDHLESAVRSCVNILRNARITLYTIDPAGVMLYPSEYGGGLLANDPFGGNYQFSLLAKATGGAALYGRNDVDAEIDTAIRDGGSFYTLTYRPNNPPNNTPSDLKKFRRIKVTVDRPALTVTTREGYYPTAAPPPVDPQNPSRRLVADLVAADTSTMVYDGIPLSLMPSPTDPDSYTVHVDGKGLTWSPATDAQPRHTDLILMVSTFDSKGKELKRVAKSIGVNAPPDVAPTGRLDRSLDISYKFDHDPKAVRARFVVRVTSSSRIGTVDAVLGQKVAPNTQAP